MINCYYRSTTEADFEKAVCELLASLDCSTMPVRLVFFGSPINNDVYNQQDAFIRQTILKGWGKRTPAVSYVAQKPLEPVGLIMEVHEIAVEQELSVAYKRWEEDSYVVVEKGEAKFLFIGGMRCSNLSLPILEQADFTFGRIRAILNWEGFPIHAIVRQWNYIERITDMDHGRQHYQDFNDARTAFYHETDWADGYPAATGIGMQAGGVVIDLDACLNAPTHAIDNPLQIAAHQYTREVLVGEAKQVTTPKFERAKSVGQHIYISGTAAIRGEETLETDIEQQTVATIENIAYLISPDNLHRYGQKEVKETALHYIRVYLKEATMLDQAREVINRYNSVFPIIYTLADVCRDNLLIELEGCATCK